MAAPPIKYRVVPNHDGYNKTLYATGFGVERYSKQKIWIAHFDFTLANRSVDCVSIVLSDRTIEDSRDSLLDYLDKVSDGSHYPEVRLDKFSSTNHLVADLISLARREDYAETGFHLCPYGNVTSDAIRTLQQTTKTNKDVDVSAMFVCRIRSPLAVQIEFVKALYDQ